MEGKKVLLMISNSVVGDRLEQAFYRASYEVLRTDNGKQAVHWLQTSTPQAMIVDWDIANGSVDEIRRLINDQFQKTALILLSENRPPEERIHALEEGADDCLSSYPAVDELVAKVNALIRRINLVDHTPRNLQIKDIQINLDTHEVRKSGKLIDLTYTQFKLLYLLASKRDYIFTRNEILDKVWGENAYVTDRTVDVHVKRLREKLGEDRLPSRYIQTIHGLGYRFA
ncbi:response regulator transcription factor [bacterium]|nr:response regulator transcription factor [bacterium]